MSLVIYFGLIKPVEIATKKLKHTEEEPVAAPTTADLLIEIRDELRSRPVQ